jgi:hypothetical protein
VAAQKKKPPVKHDDSQDRSLGCIQGSRTPNRAATKPDFRSLDADRRSKHDTARRTYWRL